MFFDIFFDELIILFRWTFWKLSSNPAKLKTNSNSKLEDIYNYKYESQHSFSKYLSDDEISMCVNLMYDFKFVKRLSFTVNLSLLNYRKNEQNPLIKNYLESLTFEKKTISTSRNTVRQLCIHRQSIDYCNTNFHNFWNLYTLYL